MVGFDLKAFRKKYKLKQVDMAKLFGCVQGNISAIETGKKKLEEYQARIIEEKYGKEVLEEFAVCKDFKEIKAPYLVAEEEPVYKTKNPEILAGDSVTIPREVFDQIARLTETVLSQQKTIENLTSKNR
ncbi:MAG: helix-turn-helix transcriptional regulator [Bacteroidaceae bacterium]|nr:helix-turn-helix transcriptional regulator [Bacteroidaceae bacterium]